MKIDEIMTRNVRGISPDETLGTAAQIMWENDCGVVPVIEADGRLVGIVTDRDICMAAQLQGAPLHDSRVSSAMARDVKTCSPRDTPATVQAIMSQNKIRRVPVVDDAGRLVGIVTLGDLAYLVGRETNGGDGMTWTSIGHTLAAISQPRLPRYAGGYASNRTSYPPNG
ncbi:MAG TPA: CBS domain-containing protein [Polyangiaceae bacterium]|jgi:CBS-domain-containing membrane protein|nr:CBS domain-containing protein [Polyangiaceae bacterium]